MGLLRAWLGLCSVWVAINAAIERTRVVHVGPRHGWAVLTLSGVGGGRAVACGRVVGVVAALEEEGLWRVVVVGAVRDRPLDYLTRPSHPASCRGGLVELSNGPVRAVVHDLG